MGLPDWSDLVQALGEQDFTARQAALLKLETELTENYNTIILPRRLAEEARAKKAKEAYEVYRKAKAEADEKRRKIEAKKKFFKDRLSRRREVRKILRRYAR